MPAAPALSRAAAPAGKRSFPVNRTTSIGGPPPRMRPTFPSSPERCLARSARQAIRMEPLSLFRYRQSMNVLDAGSGMQ